MADKKQTLDEAIDKVGKVADNGINNLDTSDVGDNNIVGEVPITYAAAVKSHRETVKRNAKNMEPIEKAGEEVVKDNQRDSHSKVVKYEPLKKLHLSESLFEDVNESFDLGEPDWDSALEDYFKDKDYVALSTVINDIWDYYSEEIDENYILSWAEENGYKTYWEENERDFVITSRSNYRLFDEKLNKEKSQISRKYGHTWYFDNDGEVTKVKAKDGTVLGKGQKFTLGSKDTYVISGFDPDTNSVFVLTDKEYSEGVDGGSDYAVEDITSVIKESSSKLGEACGKKKGKRMKKLNERMMGEGEFEEVYADVLDRARGYVKEGDDKNDAIYSAIDEVLMWKENAWPVLMNYFNPEDISEYDKAVNYLASDISASLGDGYFGESLKENKLSEDEEIEKYIGLKGLFRGYSPDEARHLYSTWDERRKRPTDPDELEDYKELRDTYGQDVEITGCSIFNEGNSPIDTFDKSYWEVEFRDGTSMSGVSGYNIDLYSSFGGKIDFEESLNEGLSSDQLQIYMEDSFNHLGSILGRDPTYDELMDDLLGNYWGMEEYEPSPEDTDPILRQALRKKFPGLKETLDEDTVKTKKGWVNKGKSGTHGTFRTKKAADAQRKAMFASGYKGESLNQRTFKKHTLTEDRDLTTIDKTVAKYLKDHMDELPPEAAFSATRMRDAFVDILKKAPDDEISKMGREKAIYSLTTLPPRALKSAMTTWLLGIKA